MTKASTDSDSLRKVFEILQQLGAATSAAIRMNDPVAERLLALLVETHRVGSSLDVMRRLPPVLEHLATVIEQIVGGVLPDILQRSDDHLADIRRFLLEPQETYGIADLAILWRVTEDDVRSIFHEELAEWSDANPADPSSFRIAWANAVGTSVHFNLLRPYDVEVALGDDFVRARSGKWRTIPILIRLPRFIVDTLSAEQHTRGDRRTNLGTHVEQFVLELFDAEYRTSLGIVGDDERDDPRP